MSSTDTVQYVTNYLTNFFADASEDQIKTVVEKTDEAIIQVVSTLIDHDISFQEILEKTTKKIERLEDLILRKDKKIKDLKQQPIVEPKKVTSRVKSDNPIDYILLEKLKMLKSATYNAKLFPICQDIFKRYLILNQPISLKQIHKEFGQDRVISSFKQDNDSKNSPIAQLLSDLFIIENINNDLKITPSAMGIALYNLSQSYYSPETTMLRFDELLVKSKLSDSKKLILKHISISEIPFTNNSDDKIRLAEFCKIHKDNISKYLVQLVKLGLIHRIPNEYSNNLFEYQCFNDSIIEKL